VEFSIEPFRWGLYLIISTEFSNSWLIKREQFKPNPNKTFDKELFSESELQILESVAERLKNSSTNEIIEISPKEKAWFDNYVERKLIDYNYSFELN
jgi:hypothetical protein